MCSTWSVRRLGSTTVQTIISACKRIARPNPKEVNSKAPMCSLTDVETMRYEEPNVGSNKRPGDVLINSEPQAKRMAVWTVKVNASVLCETTVTNRFMKTVTKKVNHKLEDIAKHKGRVFVPLMTSQLVANLGEGSKLLISPKGVKAATARDTWALLKFLVGSKICDESDLILLHNVGHARMTMCLATKDGQDAMKKGGLALDNVPDAKVVVCAERHWSQAISSKERYMAFASFLRYLGQDKWPSPVSDRRVYAQSHYDRIDSTKWDLIIAHHAAHAKIKMMGRSIEKLCAVINDTEDGKNGEDNGEDNGDDFNLNPPTSDEE
jgi:hypothetical protein